MILRKVLGRNKFISAFMEGDICVTSAVINLTTNQESMVGVVDDWKYRDLLREGFTDESILTLIDTIRTKFTGGVW